MDGKNSLEKVSRGWEAPLLAVARLPKLGLPLSTDGWRRHSDSGARAIPSPDYPGNRWRNSPGPASVERAIKPPSE